MEIFNMKFITFFIFSLLLFLTGCEDKASGVQNINSIPPLGSTEKVTLVEYMPKNNIAQSSYIRVVFSSLMKESTFNESTITLKNSSNILIPITFFSVEETLFIKPSQSLVIDESYDLNIQASISDILNNTLAQSYSHRFTCKEDFWDRVDAGQTHTSAISKDGDLYTWGADNQMKLISIDATTNTIPLGITALGEDAKGLSAGSFSSAAIKNDATFFSTGQNSISSSSNDYYKVSLGNAHSTIIKEDGTLWSWGKNNSGQIGNAGIFNQTNPVQEYSNDTTWSEVSAGEDYTIALKLDGTMWGWGDNEHGQIGNALYKERRKPVKEDTNATNWNKISAGANHSTAIKEDGTLFSWGYNSSGELGNASNTQSFIASQEATFATDWISVSAGYNHTLGLKTDGSIWAWGNNYYGQLGNNSTQDSNTPIQIGSDTNWKNISAGKLFSAATKNDGTLWSWGYAANGQLGLGNDKDDKLIPTEIK